MKHYHIEDNLIICNTWFGVSEMHTDYNLFKDFHILKYLSEIEKLRSVSVQFKMDLDSKKFGTAKETAENFIKDNNLSAESMLNIFQTSEAHIKYLDDLPNLVPESLKGKKLILTGLQTNAFTGPKIIQL